MDQGNIDPRQTITLPTGEVVRTDMMPKTYHESKWDSLTPFEQAYVTAQEVNANSFKWDNRDYSTAQRYPTRTTAPILRSLYKPNLRRMAKPLGVLYAKSI